MKNLYAFIAVILSSATLFAHSPAADCSADFEFTVDGLTVSFTDLSVADPGPILEWTWDFGDGTTSTEANPVHTYAAAGEYDVCLTIHADGGCFDDKCESNIPVGAAGGDCVANVELIGIDGSTATLIADVSPTPDAVTYTWYFGDGSTFSETTAGGPSDVAHTYAAPGSYNVCVVITTAGGCVDEDCYSITIDGGDCNADFEYTIDGGIVHFYETATGGDVVEYSWEFGDGGTSTDPNPSHIFGLTGTFEVCLTIYTADGCTDTYCGLVVIGDGDCASDFEFDTDGLTVHFFETADGAGADIVSYNWYFGDGTNSDAANPVHNFLEPGTYEVCLTITTADGCTASYCTTITVEADAGPCEAYFTISSIELTPDGYVVNFENTSGAAADITATAWYFGDGGVADSYDAEHLYTESGVYIVCLTIVTADGCSDEYCYELVLGGGDCTSGFEFSVSGMVVNFFETATGGGADIVSYAWDFGDDSTGDGPNPEHVYAEPGSYEVCLTITTADGCVSTWCDVVVIEGEMPPCEADFTITDITETPDGWIVSLENDAYGSETYAWTFGDGGTSDGVNPEHLYAEAGVYTICLTIGEEGTDCFDTYCTEIFVGGDDECISEEMIDSTYGCTEEYDPVCGCNNITYSNECYAQYYGGVVYWTQGACAGTGVQEENIFGSMQLSPNPANTNVNIRYAIRTEAEVTIRILSMTGANATTPIQHQSSPGVYTVSIDVTSLSSGVYVVQLQAGNHLQTHSLVIAK